MQCKEPYTLLYQRIFCMVQTLILYCSAMGPPIPLLGDDHVSYVYVPLKRYPELAKCCQNRPQIHYAYGSL